MKEATITEKTVAILLMILLIPLLPVIFVGYLVHHYIFGDPIIR